MKARTRDTLDAARRDRQPGEVVAACYRQNPDGSWGLVEAGVIPAAITVDTPRWEQIADDKALPIGEIHQPTAEFLADYWARVTEEAQRAVSQR